MMMERLRWLVAVLAAFVAGWVGHAVYGEQGDVDRAPVDECVASASPSRPSSTAVPTGSAASLEPSVISSSDQGVTPGAATPERHVDMFSTPGAVDALLQAVEASNRQWMAEFEVEPVDEAWATQAEEEIRRGLSAEPMFGQGRVESILCKSSKCRLIILNERQEATHENTPDLQAPERAWPTLRAGSRSYQRLPDGQPGYRATVFLERKPPAPAPGG